MDHIDEIRQFLAAEKSRLALSQEKLKDIKDIVLDGLVTEFHEKRLGGFFSFLTSLPEKEPPTHNELRGKLAANFHGQKFTEAYGVSKELAEKITAIQEYGSSHEILKISQPLRQDFTSKVAVDEQAIAEHRSISRLAEQAENKLLKLTGHRFDTVKREDYEGWSFGKMAKYAVSPQYRDIRKTLSSYKAEGNFFDIPKKLQAATDKMATTNEARQGFNVDSLRHLETMAGKLKYLEEHPYSFFSGDILPLFSNDEFSSQAGKYLGADIIKNLHEYRQVGDDVLMSRQMIVLLEKLLKVSSPPSAPEGDDNDGRAGLERTIEQSCLDAVEKIHQYQEMQQAEEEAELHVKLKASDDRQANAFMEQIRLDVDAAMKAHDQLLELEEQQAREKRVERLRESMGGRLGGLGRDYRDGGRGGYER